MSFVHQPEQLSGLKDRILARAFLLYRKDVGMTISAEIFVGIDVAKDKLDIAILGETKASQVTNDKEGIARRASRSTCCCTRR